MLFVAIPLSVPTPAQLPSLVARMVVYLHSPTSKHHNHPLLTLFILISVISVCAHKVFDQNELNNVNMCMRVKAATHAHYVLQMKALHMCVRTHRVYRVTVYDIESN